MGNHLKKFVPAPPRVKLKKRSFTATTHAHAIAIADTLRQEGWRTMVEGGLRTDEVKKCRHRGQLWSYSEPVYAVWYWEKPKQRRAA